MRRKRRRWASSVSTLPQFYLAPKIDEADDLKYGQEEAGG
jgi:hypothetical protein